MRAQWWRRRHLQVKMLPDDPRPPVTSIIAALVPPEASKFLASHPSKLSELFTKALGNATVSCLLRLGSYPLLNQRQLYDE
jgi:hypothetical protein